MNGGEGAHRPDWYPDPWGRYEYRFHNGARWTADVSSGGERYVDVPGATFPNTQKHETTVSRARRDRRATTAMVLGIIALTTTWMPYIFVVGALCAVLAVALGVAALRRRDESSRGFAFAGVVTGGAAMLLVVVGVVTTRLVAQAIDAYENPPRSSVEITRCEVDGRSLHVEGMIDNRGRQSSDYRIIVRIPGGEPLEWRRVVIEVDDLDAGESEHFSATHEIPANTADRGTEPTCRVVGVTGPLPFGIDPGR